MGDKLLTGFCHREYISTVDKQDPFTQIRSHFELHTIRCQHAGVVNSSWVTETRWAISQMQCEPQHHKKNIQQYCFSVFLQNSHLIMIVVILISTLLVFKFIIIISDSNTVMVPNATITIFPALNMYEYSSHKSTSGSLISLWLRI